MAEACESKRLYISNLCSSVIESDLRRLFSPYGLVNSVDIKHKKDIDGKTTSSFAFLFLKASEKKVLSSISALHNSKIKGRKISVELAKESFLSRLTSERESSHFIEARLHKGTPYVKILKETEETYDREDVDGVEKSGVVSFESQDLIPYTPSLRTYYSSSEEEEGEEEKKDDKIRKLGKQVNPLKSNKTLSSSSFSKDFLSNLESSHGDCWGNDFQKTLIEPSSHFMNKQSSNTKTKTMMKKKTTTTKSKDDDENENEKDDDNKKRVKRNKERQRELKRRKDVLKISLGQGCKTSLTEFENKRQDEEEENKGKMWRNSDSKKKKNLFDETSNEEEDPCLDLSIKPQFEGLSGQQLLDLQSNFGNDERFKMSSSFASSLSESTQWIPKTKKDKNTFIDVSKFRYDPSREKESKKKSSESSQYESTNTKTDSSLSNSSALRERYYDVSCNLVNSFKGNSSKDAFSLLKTFGKDDAEVTEFSCPKKYSTKTFSVPLRDNFLSANPFRYDSTDDEDEGEERGKKTEKDKENPIEKINSDSLAVFGASLKQQSSNHQEPFFLRYNDPRFEEAIEFLSVSNISSEERRRNFEKERPILATILKKKMRKEIKRLEKASFGTKKTKGYESKKRGKFWNTKKRKNI